MSQRDNPTDSVDPRHEGEWCAAMLEAQQRALAEAARAARLREAAIATDAQAAVQAAHAVAHSTAWRGGHAVTRVLNRLRRRPDVTGGALEVIEQRLDRILDRNSPRLAARPPSAAAIEAATAAAAALPEAPAVAETSVVMFGGVGLPRAALAATLSDVRGTLDVAQVVVVGGHVAVAEADLVSVPGDLSLSLQRTLGFAKARCDLVCFVPAGARLPDQSWLRRLVAGLGSARGASTPDGGLFLVRRSDELMGTDPVSVLGRSERVSEVDVPVALSTTSAAVQPHRAFDLRIAARNEKEAKSGGDWHLAAALARALTTRGHAAEVVTADHWGSAGGAIALTVRGRRRIPVSPEQANVLWLISHPDAVTDDELADYDAVLVASAGHAARIRSRTLAPVSVLNQFSDLAPQLPAAHRAEVLFVGHRHADRVRAVEHLDPDLLARTTVIGDGWDGRLGGAHAILPSVPYADLAGWYASADVTLCDHWPDMRSEGYVNNRVYDVLAVGGVALVDDVVGVPEEVSHAAAWYPAQEGPSSALRALLEDAERRAELRAAGPQVVRSAHTAGHAAETLLSDLERHGIVDSG